MYVYATASCFLSLDGAPVFVEQGSAWTPDHPLVRAYPGNFADHPATVNGAPVVEQATANPGEVRRVRRG